MGYALGASPASKKKHHNQIPDRHKLPPHVLMDREGLILPESIIDTADLEHQYSSVRSYQYYMNKISAEEWERRQAEDKNGKPPIRLEDIEKGIKGANMKEMLANMTSRAYHKAIGDMELCDIIDSEVRARHGDETIYTIPLSALMSIAAMLKDKYRLSKERISRCLALNANEIV